MALFKRKKKKDAIDGSLSNFEHLMNIKPSEKYIFRSDYFDIDDSVACILSFFHQEGAMDNFGPFWGVNRIPGHLPDGVSVVLFEQNRRYGEGWIRDNQSKAEGTAKTTSSEHEKTGTHTSRAKARQKTLDYEVIAQELQNGAAYLNVHYRLLVKAPSEKVLDDTLMSLERLYIDRFATVSAAPYVGEQRRELTNLFKKNAVKEGKGFDFTSTEYAGAYSLVTHGMEDSTGEYVGSMTGDVNNAAILFDANKYEHHVVVADERYDDNYGRAHISDMWGSKIAQSALLNNGRVVHIVMNGANLDNLGPKFDDITARIDMESGDVNMFEMFGKNEDVFSIFPRQMQKLILMAEQAYQPTDSDRSIIRGELERIATNFYVSRKMWYRNAQKYKKHLRIVGIPHKEVPLLQEFVTHLSTAHKSELAKTPSDPAAVHAYKILHLVFENLLNNNGRLFNRHTSSAIDGAVEKPRVVYDFGGLIAQGRGIAMAQLVNVIGLAVGTLGRNDVVIIHGVDQIVDKDVKAYIQDQLMQLYRKGGRVAYLYDNIEAMLEDEKFCRYTRADYTIFGSLTEPAIAKYQQNIGQMIPRDLTRLIAERSQDNSYIRRGHTNVVFRRELNLGINRRRGQRG